MRKLYIILTTIIYISFSFVLVCALTLSSPADTITTYFNRTYGITDPWDSQLDLSYAEIYSYTDSIINPFIPNDYIVNGQIVNTTPVTERYDHYGVVSVLDNGKQKANTSVYVGTDSFTTSAGAVNTITFELCIPGVSSYSNDFLTNNCAVVVGGRTYYPDSLNVIATDPIIYHYIYGAPTDTPYTIQAFKFSVYFDTPFEVNAGAYFSMFIPVHAFDFSENLRETIGIVWGYSDIELDFYETLDEAQNAHIINSLDKFPNKVKYDGAIDFNESLAGEFSEVQNFEQSLYDNMSFSEGFDQGTTDDINYLFGKLDFLFSGWVVLLILSGISLACIAYALYGGS